MTNSPYNISLNLRKLDINQGDAESKLLQKMDAILGLLSLEVHDCVFECLDEGKPGSKVEHFGEKLSEKQYLTLLINRVMNNMSFRIFEVLEQGNAKVKGDLRAVVRCEVIK